MAFDNSFSPDDEQLQQQGSSGPQSLGPSSSVISGGAPSGGGSAKGTSSGQFTNLDNYLNANADAGLGSQLAGKVQGQVDQANQAQSAVTGQFNSDVDKGTVNLNQEVLNSATSDPTAFVQDPNNVNAFQSQLNASYGGPKSLSEEGDKFNNAYQATQNATQAANATKTDPGRFALLDQYFNAPGYSQGEKNLDQFLVSSDPNAQTAFGNVQSAAQNASQGWNNAQAAGSAYAQKGADTTAATKRAASDSLYGTGGTANQLGTGGAFQNLNSDINNSVSAANDTAAQKYQAYLNTFNNPTTSQFNQGATGKSYNLSTDQLKELGLGDQDYYAGNLNLGGYLSQGPAATASNAATSDQAAKLTALDKLGGLSNNPLNLDLSQAGTYSGTPQFQAGQFQQDSAVANQQAQAQFAPQLQAYRNAIDSGDQAAQQAAAKSLAAAQQAAGYYNQIRDSGLKPQKVF